MVVAIPMAGLFLTVEVLWNRNSFRKKTEEQTKYNDIENEQYKTDGHYVGLPVGSGQCSGSKEIVDQ